jgi:predicted RNase H-like HicB family nuclease
LQRNFDVVVERDEEGYYVASVPSLPGCHTQAKSLDELNRRIREAIELCIEVEGLPDQNLEFVGIQRIVIAARADARASLVPTDPSASSGRIRRRAHTWQSPFSSP